MKQLLWYLLAGTRGGETRCIIINHLKQKPSNAHQLTTALKLDYKTIRHHLDVLEKNRLIMAINKGEYGAVFFLTPEFDAHATVFDEIWAQFGKK
jgi:DNA-binding transcriptional ArsR family regulator